MAQNRTELELILNSEEEYISHERLASALDLTGKSLIEARSKGRYRLVAYRLGNRMFYRRSDILRELESE